MIMIGKTVWFYKAGGISISDIERVSVSNSQVKASRFQAFQYPDYPRYIFSLAEDVGIDQPQELIIFEEKSLFFLKQTGRFAPTMAVGNEEDLDIVGSIYFTPKDRNGKLSPTDLLLYYSSNPCNISKCKYIMEIDQNASTIEEALDPDDGFILMIPELGTIDGHSKKVTEVFFYDHSGKLVYSEKRADGSKSFYPDSTSK